jgi:hypothetical protein
MNLNNDFTLSEDELVAVRQAIIKTIADYLAQQK